jgi:threonine-phosphate decarboxylase
MLTKKGELDIDSLMNEGFSRASPRTHGGLHYLKGGMNKSVIDFSTNVNPLGPSAKAVAVIKKSIKLASYYPDPSSKELKDAIAKYIGVESDCVVVGNGASEIIHLFAEAFVRKGDRVTIPMPTFFEYEFASDKNSAIIDFVELKDFRFDRNRVINSIHTETKVVFICNPNNPTGILVQRSDIESVLEHASNTGALVMLDECFMEFVDEPERNSLTKQIGKYENLVVLKTFTKAFGLAGLRVGYCLAGKKIARVLNRGKIPWSVNVLAQKAAVAALSDIAHLEKTRRLIRKERKYLYDKINRVDRYYAYTSDTNFFLVKLKDMSSLELQQKLLKRKILVRDCSSFTGMGTDFVRISIQKHGSNVLLVNALKEI